MTGVFSACLGFALALFSTQSAIQAKNAPPVKKSASLPIFTVEREAAALKFVARHHEELAPILGALKDMNTPRYEEAVGDIFQKSEMLADLAERDAEQHVLALAEWKNRSRLSVSAAKLQGGDLKDNKRMEEMRRLLAEQFDLRIKRKQLERSRAMAVAKRAEEAIAKMESSKEQQIEQQMRRLIRAGERSDRPTSKTKKSAPADGALK